MHLDGAASRGSSPSPLVGDTRIPVFGELGTHPTASQDDGKRKGKYFDYLTALISLNVIIAV